MATLVSVPPGIRQKAPMQGPVVELRPAAVLPLSPAFEAPANDLDAEAADEVEVTIDFTLGASTGGRVRVEASHDLATWVAQSVYDAATGNLTRLEVTLASTIVLPFRFVPARRYVRFPCAALTGVAGTLMRLTAHAIHASRTAN